MPQMSVRWDNTDSKSSQSNTDQGLKSLSESSAKGFSPGSGMGGMERSIEHEADVGMPLPQQQARRLPQGMTISKPTTLDMSTGAGQNDTLTKQPFREPLPSPGRWALGGGASLISPSHHGLGWKNMFPSRASGTQPRTAVNTTTPTVGENQPANNLEGKSSFFEWWS